MATDNRPICVVLALTATGMAVARDLQPVGWRVLGVDADRSRPGWFSRTVERPSELAALPLGADLLAAVCALARGPAPVVVMAAADDAVGWCIDHHAELVGNGVRLATGYTDQVAAVLLDKSRFGQRCRELNIDVPATMQPDNRNDIEAFAREVGFPLIVKPRAGHLWRQKLRGKKLLTPATLEQLRRDLDEIIGDPASVVLQELVAGPESNLFVGAVWAGQDAQVRQVVTARKVRQFPRNFGSGSLVRTEELPQVAQMSRQVVEALGYAGVCGTEFKLDLRTNKLRLIEINARPTLWYDLCRAAGVHLLRAHACDLAGLPCAPLADQRQGVVWRYGLRDAIALAQAGIGPLLRATLREPMADTDAVFSARDPLAAVGSLVHTTLQAAQHLGLMKK